MSESSWKKFLKSKQIFIFGFYKFSLCRLMDLQLSRTRKSVVSNEVRIQMQRRSISLNTYRRLSKNQLVKDIKQNILALREEREKKKKLLNYLESDMDMVLQQK